MSHPVQSSVSPEQAAIVLAEHGVLHLYAYSVNLDERGDFYADVRDPVTDKTVYQVRSDEGEPVFDEDGEDIGSGYARGEIPEIVDGFMRHARDIDGLLQHLVQVGVVERDASLMMLNDAEHRIERAAEEIGSMGELRDIWLAELEGRSANKGTAPGAS